MGQALLEIPHKDHIGTISLIFGQRGKLYYCVSKKSWPILHCNLLYKMGDDFLDI